MSQTSRTVPVVHDRCLDELTPRELYGILRLRSQVFVVEQTCVFLEPDGRDLAPTCRHLWIARDGDGGSEIIAAARVFNNGDARQIGRVVTDAAHRRRGLAAHLVEHFLTRYAGPWVLDGQSHLADWYRRYGFEVSGEEYLDDGIPHVPMRRDR